MAACIPTLGGALVVAARSESTCLGAGRPSPSRSLPPAQVNTYPSQRLFKAIGSGGDAFARAMTACVESALGQPVPPPLVSQRLSAGGKYVAVSIGPLPVQSPDQVLAVFRAMRSDARLEFYL